MSDARQIIEAIDPKRVLRQARGGKVRQVLTRDRWEHLGSNPLAWHKIIEKETNYYPRMDISVWWDDKAGQWVIKREGQKKYFGRVSGKWVDLGFSTWNTDEEVIQRLVELGALYLWR